MRCVRCQQENPPESNFCSGCGTRLGQTCALCGAALLAGSRFCNKCGIPLGAQAPASRFASPASYTPKRLAERILTSKSALEGERKHVTALFADVKGSMELAEQVDAEEWHTILDRFFDILTEGVHRFEGTVNQYTGDGIMALFGAPIAHEDHAQRACYAALHLRERLNRYTDELRLSHGLNFGVRMGMNSGEVIVGKIGDDLRMDYTAQGQTVNLAARMQQIAAAGRVYLTDFTARQVEGYFRLREIGLLRIKGIPIAWCARSRRWRFRRPSRPCSPLASTVSLNESGRSFRRLRSSARSSRGPSSIGSPTFPRPTCRLRSPASNGPSSSWSARCTPSRSTPSGIR